MRSSQTLNKLLAYLLMILVACLTVGPFLWLLSTSLKSTGEAVYSSNFFPESPTLQNYTRAMEAFPFWVYFFNSLLVAVIATISNIIFSTLAAYPLARLEFRGKTVIFTAILATMMIPFQLLMIALYELCVRLGIQNTYFGLVTPYVVTGFGVFLMRQALIKIPRELDESAFMDGANSLQILCYILFPLLRSALVTLAIFSFIGVWGDFLWPLIIVNKNALFTLPLGVNKLNGAFASDMKVISAGAVLSVIPMLIIFVCLQRYFIKGAFEGSVKG